MKQSERPRPNIFLLAFFLLFNVGIGAVGYVYYRDQREILRARQHNELAAIADTKASYLAAWRQERLADARVLSSNPWTLGAVRHLRSSRSEGEVTHETRRWLGLLRDEYGYEDVVLLDRDGTVLLANSATSKQIERSIVPLLEEALGTRRAVLSRLHPSEATGRVHMDVVAPVIPAEPGSAPIGAILLAADPYRFLYPQIQAWPTPSPTGEILLVRRDGDRAVYLNEVRHRKGASYFGLPVARDEMPGVMAALGREGVFEGADYRGVATIAAIRRVQDSPWYVAAKVDEEELYAPLRERAWYTATVVLLLMAASGVCAGLFWRQQRLRFDQQRFQAQLERQALVRHYDYLAKYANDIIILTDDEGRIVEANDRAVSVYGYTREELLRLNIRDLRLPEASPLLEKQWAEARQRQGLVFETVHRRKDGSTFPAEVSARLIQVDSARFRQKIVRDITERKHAERNLIRLNRLYAVLGRINRTLVRADTAEELYCMACRIAVEDGGFRMAWIGMVDPETLRVKPVAWWGFEEGHLGRIRISAAEQEAESRGVTGTAIREGRCDICNDVETDPRMLLWREEAAKRAYRSIAAIPLKVGGRVAGAMTLYAGEPDVFHEEEAALMEAIAGDIGFALESMEQAQQRRRAEAELEASEQRYKALFDNIPTGIYRTTPDGWILNANPALVQMLGYSSFEELAARNLEQEGFEPTYPRERYKEVLEREGQATLESAWIRRDGSVVYVREIAKAIRGGDGRVLFYEGTVEDITERKRLESQLQQSQKMEAVGRLAGGVAHDFNNLLTVIMGYNQMLLKNLTPDHPLRPAAEQVSTAADRAVRLTRQLLAFSRQQVFQPKVLDLNAVVADLAIMLRRVIGEDIELNTAFGHNLGRVRADQVQVEQVLLNLSVNARDAMPRGGKLSIRTATVEADEQYCRRHPGLRPGAYVTLEVSDTGCGMDAETQARVFEPFFTTKAVGEGTGLGLSTVYGIVKQSGGYTYVASELGRGATFT